MTKPSNWHEDNGFKYRLFPAKTEKPDCVIVYLHCLDGNAEIPYRYLRALQDKIPGADVIVPQAPIKTQKSPFVADGKGYSWFPLGGEIATQIKTWIAHITKRLTIAEQMEAFAHAHLVKRGLTEDKLAYYGHSMGGIVALQAGLSGDKPVAAIVSSSGSVIPMTKVKNKSKVFLQMGGQDEVFNAPMPPMPPKGFLKRIFAKAVARLSLGHARSIERLHEQGVPLTEKVYPKQGHLQSYKAWTDGVEFMAKALARREPNSPTG